MAESSGEEVAAARVSLPRVAVPRVALALVAPLVCGVVAWGFSLDRLRHVPLGVREVPGVLPDLWWLSLTALLAGAVVVSCSSKARVWLLAAYVIALALVLYGTIPTITDVPQYAWTYKHVGVVRLIELRGAVDPSVDIYNRWPGFFSAAAALSQVVGLTDPVSYAAWSELLFALVDALLVAALAWSMFRDTRITGLATVLFTVGNWVGQGYFSPQATVFPLALATLLLTMRYFAGGRVGTRTIRLVELVVRRRQSSAEQLPPGAADSPAGGARARRTAGGAAILALDAAIVASHQLTPYVLLIQLGGLAIVGVLRPRWILGAMAVITIAYLLPNLGFINRNYGLFTSLDPFANAQAQATTARPVLEPWIDKHAGQLLALLFLAGAAVASVLIARRGLAQRALPLIVFAAAPVALLFGQGYGGEASLRTFMFSAPSAAILISWAIVERAGRRARPFVGLGVSALVAGLFVPAYFAQTWVNVIPRGEVVASEYFYAHAPDGAALVTAGPDFPTRVGARYAVMRSASLSDASPSLLIDGHLAGRMLGRRTVPTVVSLMRGYSPDSYLAFSTTESRLAAVDSLAPRGALASLRRAVRDSGMFELWYAAPDVRIYRLLAAEDPATIALEAHDRAEDAAPNNTLEDRKQVVFGAMQPFSPDN